MGGAGAPSRRGWSLASLTCRGDREVVPTGALLAVVLACAVFVATMLGGLGLEEALARAARAGLLVLVATWLRAAAGATGLREVSRRGLGRLRRAAVGARGGARDGRARDRAPARVGGALGARGAAATVERRPVPVLDAVLGWVAAESRRFRPRRAPSRPLRACA